MLKDEWTLKWTLKYCITKCTVLHDSHIFWCLHACFYTTQKYGLLDCVIMWSTFSEMSPVAVRTMSSVQEVHGGRRCYGLHFETKVIVERFASLQRMTQQYLEENCTTESLVTCILDVRHVKPCE